MTKKFAPTRGKYLGTHVDGTWKIVDRGSQADITTYTTTIMSAGTSIPDADTLAKASELNVQDVKGETVSFGSIFKDRKTIVVFIRSLTTILVVA